MSNFGGRIDVLERRLGGRGCPVCGAGSDGPRSFALRRTEDGPPAPCPACGEVPIIFTLRLGERDGDGDRLDD